jgi:hypothetical protein
MNRLTQNVNVLNLWHRSEKIEFRNHLEDDLTEAAMRRKIR